MNGDEPTQEVSDDRTTTSRPADSSVFGNVRDRISMNYSSATDTYTKYVLALSLALFVFFSIYLSLRYLTYNLTGSDFGSYVHMFATTLSGKGWLLQGKYIASHPYGSYWGGHFSLTLLAFLPIFALFPSPYTLIVSKSFVLAASVVVLWMLARDRLESDRFALLVTVSYALNPFLWSAWTFDFQEQILLPPLLFGAYYAYANARQSRIWRVLFLPLLALVLLTNEFVVILVGGFLLGMAVAAYRNDRFRERLPLLTGGAILTVAVHVFAGWVIAHFSVASGIPPSSIADPIQPLVGQGRSSIVELMMVMLTHPAVIFETLATDAFTKGVFFIMLFVPVLFLALRDETTLGAIAPFFVFAWLFTGRAAYYTFSAHYPLYLLPFIYIGTVRVLARMEEKYPLVSDSPSMVHLTNETSLNTAGKLLSRLFVVVLVVSAIGSVAVMADKNEPLSIPDEHDELRDKAFELIPPNASLITQNDLYPHVATRPNATYIPNEGTFTQYRKKYGLPTPEYIIYDTTTAWANVVIEQYVEKLGTMYGVYAYQEGIWIWKKGYHGQPTGITHEEPSLLQYSLDALGVNEGERRHGTIVSTNASAGQTIWYGPYAMLPAGTYTVTYEINATGTDSDPRDGPIVVVDVAVGVSHQRIAHTTVLPTNGTERVRLTFTLNQMRRLVEFRGFSATPHGIVKLKSITVNRTGPAKENEND